MQGEGARLWDATVGFSYPQDGAVSGFFFFVFAGQVLTRRGLVVDRLHNWIETKTFTLFLLIVAMLLSFTEITTKTIKNHFW